jgi:hypothetical protein
MSVTITSYSMVPRSCDQKMKLLILRQAELTGTDGAWAGTVFSCALSSLILASSEKNKAL